ncbi:Uncharacterized protein SSS_07140 [Sarcoptes scabiei]|uniref:DUF389 domain containing protein n=1 Tax=Sarcoptes scabiei TaxID=52283 RepID=A0A834VDQ9_SARSC|nr:Uncharacterized protein SSS_07140 [Sarcoptes scabiei]
MSSVLVVIIIPEIEKENELLEKEKNLKKLHKKSKKEVLINPEPVTVINENDAGGEDAKEGGCDDRSLEKIMKEGLSYLGISDATWQKSFNGEYWHILFPVDLEDSDIVIQYFKSHGIGLRLTSSIGIIPFTLFCYNEESNESDDLYTSSQELSEKNKDLLNFKEKQNKFLKSVTARLTVAQIVQSVRTNATVTFDFICYLIFASWIAAMGLLDNSVVSLVASMLVSPMMGPVMAFTFGTIIKDRSLRHMGFKNIFICLFVTITFGFLFGIIALNFTNEWNSYGPWPTDMMRERGLYRVIWVGTLVAFPSGCAVAISLLSGNDASLVGVAISVSLLPPAVNAGLLWSFSLLKFLYSIGDENFVKISSQLDRNRTISLPKSLLPPINYAVVYDDNMSVETLMLGLLSLALSLINIANIIIGALILLKIKEIAPLTSLSPENRRFFQEDIKIAREYNQRSNSSELGVDILKEYASMVGLDSEKVLNPEARAVQLHTLADIARDVEADEVFQTITKGINNTNDLARRLSQGIFTNNLNDRHYKRRATSAAIFNSQTSPSSPMVSKSLANHSNNHTNHNQQQSHHHHYQQQQQNPMNRRASKVAFGGGQRRRISTVALNHFHETQNSNQTNGNKLMKHGSSGYLNQGFHNSIESDLNNLQQQIAYDRARRDSSSILRITLQNHDHSPFSLWPKTRFTVQPSHSSMEKIYQSSSSPQPPTAPSSSSGSKYL